MSDNPLSSENTASLIARAKAMIMQPKAEWPKVAAEPGDVKGILIKYALPLIAIGPICSFIGGQLFGYNAMVVMFRPSLSFSLTIAITGFVQSIIALFIVSFIANFLSPKFGGKDDFGSAFKLIAYSMTAAWVAGVFGIIPMLGGIAAIAGGIYSIYVLFLGAAPVMAVPQDKAGGYIAVTVLVAIVVQIILNMIAASLFTPGMAF
ncbi:MAG TPA: Yip1 family protein [Sphingomonadaceae bacterium]|nr:Yip1 family protein [Sphingomonadaceae bacterium]